MSGYNQKADAALKASGNQLHEELKAIRKKLKGRTVKGWVVKGRADDGWAEDDWATKVEVAAFGIYPRGDGPNQSTDAEVEALISKVEGALLLAQALLKHI